MKKKTALQQLIGRLSDKKDEYEFNTEFDDGVRRGLALAIVNARELLETEREQIEGYEQAQNDSQPLLTVKQAESICMGFYKDLVIHLESGLSTELFHGELVFNKHLEKATK